MEGLAKRSPLPKICYSNETIMNGHKKVIAYLKKIQKKIIDPKKNYANYPLRSSDIVIFSSEFNSFCDIEK